MTRLKSLVSNPVEKSPDDEALPFYALEHIVSGVGRLAPGTEIEERADDTAVTHRPGDVRFGKLRPYLAKSLYMTEAGHGSGELLVLRPRPGGIDGRFLHYVTLTKRFVEWATATSYGVKMPRTSWEAVGQFQVEAPPLGEQQRVADYLDAETGRIDDLIAEQRRLLSLSTEHLEARRRTALLGINGLGQPSWPRGRLKRFVNTERGRFTHRPRNDPALYGGQYPFVQTGDIARAIDGVLVEWSQSLNERGLAVSRLAPKGTLVMAIAANIGDVAELGFDACFPDSVVALAPRPGLSRSYLAELMVALRPDLLGSSTLNTQLNINVDRIGDIEVSIPPPEEQDRLVVLLHAEKAHLRRISTEVNSQIGLLREHRQALITYAVTQGLDGLPGVA